MKLKTVKKTFLAILKLDSSKTCSEAVGSILLASKNKKVPTDLVQADNSVNLKIRNKLQFVSARTLLRLVVTNVFTIYNV